MGAIVFWVDPYYYVLLYLMICIHIYIMHVYMYDIEAHIFQPC